MGFELDARSRARLKGVHGDLVRIVERAAAEGGAPFRVLEGMRTPARQKALVAAGASKTLNSRHLTGHAVDLGATVEGAVRWDWPLYAGLARAMKQAAADLGLPLVWGGDWKMRDGPHFELPRTTYPAT
ncbi:MAG: M15 family metallopeptidase [Alphaproteobacteria bacterium]